MDSAIQSHSIVPHRGRALLLLLLLKIADDTNLSEGKNNSKDLSIHEFDVDYLVVEVLLPIYNLLIFRCKAMAWPGQCRTGWHWGLFGPAWDISATTLPSGHLPSNHSKPFPVEMFTLA